MGSRGEISFARIDFVSMTTSQRLEDRTWPVEKELRLKLKVVGAMLVLPTERNLEIGMGWDLSA